MACESGDKGVGENLVGRNFATRIDLRILGNLDEDPKDSSGRPDGVRSATLELPVG